MRHARRSPLHRIGRQAGFTLVEIGIALALIGVLAAMAFKSQEVVEQYRQGEFVTRVRTLEANLKAYRATYGRWPGDCNRDGLMDHEFVSATALELTESFDYTIPAGLAPAASAQAAYAPGKTCPVSSLAPWPNVNVAYNDLKLGGQLGARPGRRQ